MAIEVVSFREYQKNTLQGFVTLLLTTTGMEIRDITLHEKDGQRWISMPSKEYTDKYGERKWNPVGFFTEREALGACQGAALAAIEKHLAAMGKEQPQKSDLDDVPF